MSGRLVGEVLDHAPADLRPLDFAVLIALAEAARYGTRTATYGTKPEQLAQRVRPISSAGSVRNALSRLTSRGLIRPVRGRANRGKVQHYAITHLSNGARFATFHEP